LQCVAVCYRVLQCVALWCSVSQCVAICCSVLQRGCIVQVYCTGKVHSPAMIKVLR